MFRRIVVGADGTAEGRDAAVLGASIAAATGAGVTLLHSFTPFLISASGATDRRSLRRDAERLLAAERRRFAPDAHTEVVADGNISRALRLHAERWHADLVVIGSSASADRRRCRIGKIGRGLLASAPVALAIARRGLHEENVTLSSVAVGYDGGPESQIALRFADELATGAGAELIIETLVQERLPPLAGGGALAVEHWERLREREMEEALFLSRQAASRATARARAVARRGDPASLLRQVSQSVDLTVIGSRRWGTLARVALGGVGEALVSDCGSSLLVTHRDLRHPGPPPPRTADEGKVTI